MDVKKSILALTLLLVSQNAVAWGNWAPEPYDKALHFVSSATLTVVGYKACRRFTEFSKTACSIGAGVATFAITGPGKEYSDVNWDNRDMAASGAGTVFGMGLTLIF